MVINEIIYGYFKIELRIVRNLRLERVPVVTPPCKLCRSMEICKYYSRIVVNNPKEVAKCAYLSQSVNAVLNNVVLCKNT